MGNVLRQAADAVCKDAKQARLQVGVFSTIVSIKNLVLLVTETVGWL